MEMSLGEIAGILDAASAAPEIVARGYSIDSRTINPGELFFAISGKNFDGHDFVSTALLRGATGAVVGRGFAAGNPAIAPKLLAVADPALAFRTLATAVRKRWGKPLVAITGSAGKSTTKEMLAAILAKRYAVHRTPGNLNNEFGLPLTLLALQPDHDNAVVELAMSSAGEIARLTRIAEPNVGVVTNVAPVHLEFFDSVESIARAKRELIENLRAGSTAVLNNDDHRVKRFQQGFPGRVVTFGFEPGATFRASDLRTKNETMTEFMVSGDGIGERFELPLPGRHNVLNALAAIASASLFKVEAAEMREALAQYQTLRQRSEIITLPDGITVLNDSYNSNPLAMEKMLETIAAWPGAKRRIVVAGEMLELGPTSPELHKEVGRKCAEAGIAWLLAVRGDAKFFADGARERGFPEERALFFETAAQAGEHCLTLVQSGDLVLVKGSRGVHLEKVVEMLRAA